MTEKHVLYIEDNLHNRRIVRKILNNIGFEVSEAENGLEGYQMVQELLPPIVLLDISLPGMDGMEIARRVKADPRLSHIILIALTASAMRGDRERFLEAGCDDYLSKPFMTVELIEIVEKHYADLAEQDPLHVPQSTQVVYKAKSTTPIAEPQQEAAQEKAVEEPKPVPQPKKEPAPKPSKVAKPKKQSTKKITKKAQNKKQKKILESSIFQNINPEFINPPAPNADLSDKSTND
jgi:two-component system cell cycle response regulator DivK